MRSIAREYGVSRNLRFCGDVIMTVDWQKLIGLSIALMVPKLEKIIHL